MTVILLLVSKHIKTEQKQNRISIFSCQYHQYLASSFFYTKGLRPNSFNSTFFDVRKLANLFVKLTTRLNVHLQQIVYCGCSEAKKRVFDSEIKEILNLKQTLRSL